MGFDGCLAIGYTIFRSAFLSTPRGTKYQVNETSYLNLINDCPCAIGSAILIPGGAGVADSYPYYVALTKEYIAHKVRLFVFEKKIPVANVSVIHDIYDAVQYIRRNYPGPLVMMGYSIGGIILFSYLSFGYDGCDLYIPICCTIDALSFEKAIFSHPIFRYISENACRSFKVSNHRELISLGGCPIMHDKYISVLVRRFNSRDSTRKMFYIISSDDPLTQPIEDCCRPMKFKPHTHIIKGGWHCCIKTISFAAYIVNKYMKLRDAGEFPTPEFLDS